VIENLYGLSRADSYHVRTVSQNQAFPSLMQKSSKSPGCIRAFPASQSCQVRSVEYINAAAADCESPAFNRALRISSGVGFGKLHPACGRIKRGVRRILGTGIVLRLRYRTGTRKGFAFVAEFAVDAPYEAIFLFVELDMNKYWSVLIFVIDCDAEGKKCFHGFLLLFTALFVCFLDLYSTRIPRNCNNYFASNENNFLRAA